MATTASTWGRVRRESRPSVKAIIAFYDTPAGRKLVAVLPKHPVPEGMAAADWERKKGQSLGRACFIAGSAHSARVGDRIESRAPGGG